MTHYELESKHFVLTLRDKNTKETYEIHVHISFSLLKDNCEFEVRS